MADVQLNWTGTSSQTYGVEYKKDVDPTWITAVTGLAVTTYTVTGLDPNTLYNFRVTATCPSGTTSSPVIISHTTEGLTFAWVEDAFVCQQTDPLVIGDTYTGFSSPQNLFWDNPTGRFYVVDVDDVSGNLYYFNPVGFTGTAQRIYVPGSNITGQFTQAYDHSPSLRKIFIAGEQNGGLFVHRIADGTNGSIAQGTNGDFARLLVRILNGTLYMANKFDNTLALIDPVAETVTSVKDVTLIPGNAGNPYFNNSYQLYAVNGEIWACAGGFRASNGNIGRFSADLNTFIGEIVIPSVASPGGAWPGYWQSQFFDEEKQRFYLSDVGSRLISVIDTTTNTVVEQIPIDNNEGKAWALVGWTLNTLTGELYANKAAQDTPTDSAIIKFYTVDRDTYQYKNMFKNQTTSGLRLREGTNEFWSANTGTVGWANRPSPPPVGWDTDGQIFKYTS